MIKKIIKWLFEPTHSYVPFKERSQKSTQIYANREDIALQELMRYIDKKIKK